MIISIILFEKLAKNCRGHAGDYNHGSVGIRLLSSTFNITQDEACWFWGDWRNGLLHRCMPSVIKCTGYRIKATGDALKFEGRFLRLNPWRFRDDILKLVSAEQGFWADAAHDLPDEYE